MLVFQSTTSLTSKIRAVNGSLLLLAVTRRAAFPCIQLLVNINPDQRFSVSEKKSLTWNGPIPDITLVDFNRFTIFISRKKNWTRMVAF